MPWTLDDVFGEYSCDYFDDCSGWGADLLLLFAAETDNGYITPLNCPSCGCTEDDIITLAERNSGTRSMGMTRKKLRAMLGLE